MVALEYENIEVEVEVMSESNEDESLRERAVKRLRQKSEFKAHLISYLLVNGFLVVLWATLAGGGFFWPMFPIAGWGIGVFFHGWDVYRAEPSEDQIRKEMQRLT